MTENVLFQTKERQRLTAVHYDKIKQQQCIKQTVGFRRKHRTKDKSLNIVDGVKQHGDATQNEQERMTGPLSEMSVFIQYGSVSQPLGMLFAGSFISLVYWIFNKTEPKVHPKMKILFYSSS